MQRFLLFLFTLLMGSIAAAQTFNSAQLIDQGISISGITSIETADLNNDSLTDIIISQGYNQDKITFYPNLGQGTFGSSQLIDSAALNVEVVKVADINEDGWLDVISICRYDSSVYWYPNSMGNFNRKLRIDSNILILNDFVVHDFDGDNHQDLVVIGQHSIDLHLGDGNGNFTKTHILTTASSPNILECIDLEKADVDNDGDYDLVVAETLGAVVYANNGSAVFSPQTLNNQALTGNLVHTFDQENDGDIDVLLRHGSGSWSLFQNNGNLQFSTVSGLNSLANFKSVQTLDFNNDSLLDIYGTHMSQIDVYFNDSSRTFNSNSTVYQNNSINFIYDSDTADFNQDGQVDLVFSAVSGYLAWHEFNLPTGLYETNTHEQKDLFYPNPATDFIQLNSKNFSQLKIYTLSGKLIKEINVQGSKVSVQTLPKGSYLVQAHSNKSIISQLFIKK